MFESAGCFLCRFYAGSRPSTRLGVRASYLSEAMMIHGSAAMPELTRSGRTVPGEPVSTGSGCVGSIGPAGAVLFVGVLSCLRVTGVLRVYILQVSRCRSFPCDGWHPCCVWACVVLDLIGYPRPKGVYCERVPQFSL